MGPDLRRGLVCGNCKALIEKMNYEYKTCDEYCKRIGRICSGAWEDDDDTCQVKSTETCSHEFLDTADAICACGAHIDGFPDQSAEKTTSPNFQPTRKSPRPGEIHSTEQNGEIHSTGQNVEVQSTEQDGEIPVQ